MNIYFIIAGAIGVLGGLAHTILGDRWTIAPLQQESIKSDRFSGDENKRYIRWFWHVGSVVLLSTSILILLEGLQLVSLQRHLLLYLSFLWLSTTAVFFVIAIRPPSQALKMIPGLVGIPVNILIILGLLN